MTPSPQWELSYFLFICLIMPIFAQTFIFSNSENSVNSNSLWKSKGIVFFTIASVIESRPRKRKWTDWQNYTQGEQLWSRIPPTPFACHGFVATRFNNCCHCKNATTLSNHRSSISWRLIATKTTHLQTTFQRGSHWPRLPGLPVSHFHREQTIIWTWRPQLCSRRSFFIDLLSYLLSVVAATVELDAACFAAWLWINLSFFLSHSPPLFTVSQCERRIPLLAAKPRCLVLHRRYYHHQHIHRRSSHQQALPSSEGRRGGNWFICCMTNKANGW